MKNRRTLKYLNQEDFYQFCRMNEDIVFERDANGNVLILPLKGGKDRNFNAAISTEVDIWNRKERTGKAFNSSMGFHPV